jgi:thioredoxin 1
MDKFKEITAGTTPTLVDFYATWCGPCRTMHPILDRLSATLGDRVTILRYDIDDPQNAQLVADHNVRSVPTIVIYRAGRVVWRGSGVVSADHLADLIAKLEREPSNK